ncbi:MAG: O-antigen ligase family protein, partial [Anaerolineae bacterium]
FLAAAGLSAGMAVLVFGVDPTFVLRLMRPLAYYASFFAVTRLLWERRQVQTLLNGLLWLGALASGAVILQTAFPQLTILRASSTELVTAAREYSGVHRVYTHADRLIYPMLLLSVTFLALRVTPTWMEAGRAALLAVALILSFQRNYWGTSLLMVGLLTALVPAWARLRLAFALGAAAVLIMVSALIPSPELMRYRQAALERFVYGLSPETVAADGSAQDRVLEIEYGLQTVVERPVLGIGLGNLYRPLNANDLANREMPPAIGLRWYIHNAYLWVWVDMGLVGLIPFLWLYGAGIYRGLRSWRAMPDRRTRAVVLGLSLGLMGQAGSNLVAPNFIQSWSLLVFPVLLGLNEVILRAATQQTHTASEMVEG